MAEQKHVVIIGGHGKIALLAAPKFAEAGYTVDSIIRNPDQAGDITAARANPVVLDIEQADVDALAQAFGSAEAVVFSAGAGGGNPARTKAVDQDAAERAVDAAVKAGVKRFVIVSYAGSEVDVDRLDKDNSFYPYAEAKHHADNYLRQSGLDYTILGPGKLTTEPATGKVKVVDTDQIAESTLAETSRENVAEAIVHVVAHGAGVRETVNFFDGDTPLAEAIR